MSNYAYMKRWHHERAHGQLRTTPAEPVRAHIQTLLDAGWSLRSIADAAGTVPAIPHRIVRHGQTRVRNDLAARLLAVTPEAIGARALPRGFVLKVGAVRRIQALLAIGHRHEDITAAMLTANPTVGTRSQMVLHQRGVWIARTTFDAVRETYNALSMTPGPSTKTVRLAAKYGYLPPIAWDDDTLDDPDFTTEREDSGDDELDEIAVERIMSGTLTGKARPNERLEAVRRLAALGLSDAAISARIGTLTTSGVQQLRKRNGIEAVA